MLFKWYIQSLTSCTTFNEYMLENKIKFRNENNTLALIFISTRV
jgi:hypothetical protein